MCRCSTLFVVTLATLQLATAALAQDANAKLPRVLIIGDSISIGYTPHVARLLEGKARLERIKPNGGDSGNVLAHLKEWIGDTQYDLIHVNCGLHDLKYTAAKQSFQQSPEQYEKNLRAILAYKSGEKQPQWIFATTTPIVDERHAQRKAGFDRFNKDVLKYNEIALRVAQQASVPVTDLYQAVQDAGREKMLSKDGTHYTDEGYQMLARHVAAGIEKHLPKK